MVTISDIETAHDRIREHIQLTPCTCSETLSRMLGCTVYFKLENLQITGSFKDRGAINKILQLTPSQRAAGVIAASAGNHAQGVAHAARLAGIKSLIVMPETTPLAKIRGTRELGAQIILHGSGYDEAFNHAEQLQQEHGYTFIHAFDDPDIIAGQGTIGLELMRQVPEMDLVVVPVGGGGLLSGIATAIRTARPQIRLVGVEAKRMPAMQQSLSHNQRLCLHAANTLADGIAIAQVGKITLEILQDLAPELVTVSEEQIASAVMALLEREKTLAEGAGAVGFAALQAGNIPDTNGRSVVIVISGGNIDMTMLEKILDRGLELDGRLARLKVVVPDKPGSIAELAAQVALNHSNILQISQNRAVSEVALQETEVELVLETRGQEHVEQIIQSIREQGFRVK